jgi:hypothetical protein
MNSILLYNLVAKMDMLVIGPVPEGFRVNFPFVGKVDGKLSGKVEGVDYVLTRTDGVGCLHIHGVISSDEGDLISFEASGYGRPSSKKGYYDLEAAITFQTPSDKYRWLNNIIATSEGFADTEKGQLNIKAYVPRMG